MIKTMNERERHILSGGTIILAVIIIIFGFILPYRNAVERLDKSISQRQQQLQEVKDLQVHYKSLKSQIDRLKRESGRRNAPPLLTYLEETASNIGNRENLVLMRPLPATVQGELHIESTEFKLERQNFQQVLTLLYEIEQKRPPVRIDRLHIKQRFDDSSQLDMSMALSTARSS